MSKENNNNGESSNNILFDWMDLTQLQKDYYNLAKKILSSNKELDDRDRNAESALTELTKKGGPLSNEAEQLIAEREQIQILKSRNEEMIKIIEQNKHQLDQKLKDIYSNLKDSMKKATDNALSQAMQYVDKRLKTKYPEYLKDGAIIIELVSLFFELESLLWDVLLHKTHLYLANKAIEKFFEDLDNSYFTDKSPSGKRTREEVENSSSGEPKEITKASCLKKVRQSIDNFERKMLKSIIKKLELLNAKEKEDILKKAKEDMSALKNTVQEFLNQEINPDLVYEKFLLNFNIFRGIILKEIKETYKLPFTSGIQANLIIRAAEKINWDFSENSLTKTTEKQTEHEPDQSVKKSKKEIGNSSSGEPKEITKAFYLKKVRQSISNFERNMLKSIIKKLELLNAEEKEDILKKAKEDMSALKNTVQEFLNQKINPDLVYKKFLLNFEILRGRILKEIEATYNFPFKSGIEADLIKKALKEINWDLSENSLTKKTEKQTEHEPDDMSLQSESDQSVTPFEGASSSGTNLNQASDIQSYQNNNIKLLVQSEVTEKSNGIVLKRKFIEQFLILPEFIKSNMVVMSKMISDLLLNLQNSFDANKITVGEIVFENQTSIIDKKIENIQYDEQMYDKARVNLNDSNIQNQFEFLPENKNVGIVNLITGESGDHVLRPI